MAKRARQKRSGSKEEVTAQARAEPTRIGKALASKKLGRVAKNRRMNFEVVGVSVFWLLFIDGLLNWVLCGLSIV